MRGVVVTYFPHRLARAAMVMAAALGAASCSSDTTRFNDNPFANPYTTSENAGGGAPQPAPVARVESKPLHAQSLPPVTKAEPISAKTALGAKPMAPHNAQAHVVAPGETLSSIARHYNMPVKELVAANRLTYDAHLKIGDRLVVPGEAVAKTATAPKPAVVAAAAPALAAAPAPAAAPAANPKVASLEPQASVRVATPAAEAKGEETGSTGGGATGAPSFRWPVRGRVISGFGPLTNGQQNDGINLSVPEGTAVRAADDGVVAYSGNELKGYGNLVLVRHSNGYVTAYAHASELMVKRGDAVKRGQVIAKSGQTGNVSAPQLHFEIRKGSAPVDPTQYLPGA